MESLSETIFGILIILIVFSWTVNNLLIYHSSSSEKEIGNILNNYAQIVCQQIISKKDFKNPSENPKDYKLDGNVKIYIQIKEIEYRNGEIIDKILFESSKKPLLNKGEYVGAYINNTLIIVRVIVYE